MTTAAAIVEKIKVSILLADRAAMEARNTRLVLLENEFFAARDLARKRAADLGDVEENDAAEELAEQLYKAANRDSGAAEDRLRAAIKEHP